MFITAQTLCRLIYLRLHWSTNKGP